MVSKQAVTEKKQSKRFTFDDGFEETNIEEKQRQRGKSTTRKTAS
jgi:hypothetical protein